MNQRTAISFKGRPEHEYGRSERGIEARFDDLFIP